jgi:4-amino-4-deoxy-L-arabinose transferase-like glycosyltransferase
VAVSRTHRPLLAIGLLALLLRLGWALLVPVAPLSDSGMYDVFARRLAAGEGYSFPDGSLTVYWPVGPSALYGLFYWLFGTQYSVVVAVNILLGVGLVFVAYQLALSIWDRSVANLSALIIACWPVLIEFTTVLSSELPFMVLVSLAILLWANGEGSMWRTASAAVLMVAAAYMRPTALPFLVLLPLLGFFSHQQARRAAMQLAITIAVAALLLAPWMVRNQRIFGAPVPVSANFGVNLWMGNNPASVGGYMPLPETERLHRVSEVERDRILKQEAIAFIRAEPLRYLSLSAARIGISFGRETIGVSWNSKALPVQWQPVLKILSSAYWLLMLGGCIVGIALFIKESPRRIFDPVVVVPASTAAVAILVVGQDRYHMGIIPFAAVFASSLFARLWSPRSLLRAVFHPRGKDHQPSRRSPSSSQVERERGGN